LGKGVAVGKAVGKRVAIDGTGVKVGALVAVGAVGVVPPPMGTTQAARSASKMSQE